MREAEEVERLRPTLATTGPPIDRIPPELQNPRLRLVQRQTEPAEPDTQVGEERLGIPGALEADDTVVSISDDDDVTLDLVLPPAVRPQIEDIISVGAGPSSASAKASPQNAAS